MVCFSAVFERDPPRRDCGRAEAQPQVVLLNAGDGEIVNMSSIALRPVVALVTFLIGISASQIWFFIWPTSLACQGTPVPYVILADNGLSPIIAIGVDEGVREQDLYATLRQVADEHQNDPAREYWIQEHLTIRAYLFRNGVASYFPAATLYRYIPIRNPPEAAQKDGPRADLFRRSPWLARRSL